MLSAGDFMTTAPTQQRVCETSNKYITTNSSNSTQLGPLLHYAVEPGAAAATEKQINKE